MAMRERSRAARAAACSAVSTGADSGTGACISVGVVAEGGLLGADEAGELSSLFLATDMIQTIATTTSTVMVTGDSPFLGGAAPALGLPQCGQVGALGEISLPQSGHFTRG